MLRYMRHQMRRLHGESYMRAMNVSEILQKKLQQRMGLTENVKVIAGAGDNAAAAVGTGTVGDGKL